METEVRIFRSSSTRAMVGMSLPFAANAAPHRALKPAKLGRNVSFGRSRIAQSAPDTLLSCAELGTAGPGYGLRSRRRFVPPRQGAGSAEARRNIEERKLFRSSESSQK